MISGEKNMKKYSNMNIDELLWERWVLVTALDPFNEIKINKEIKAINKRIFIMGIKNETK